MRQLKKSMTSTKFTLELTKIPCLKLLNATG